MGRVAPPGYPKITSAPSASRHSHIVCAPVSTFASTVFLLVGCRPLAMSRCLRIEKNASLPYHRVQEGGVNARAHRHRCSLLLGFLCRRDPGRPACTKKTGPPVWEARCCAYMVFVVSSLL